MENALKTLCCFLALFLAPFFSQNAFASGFGCDGVAGGVIFEDTLYGAGTGVLIGGLYVASKEDRSDAGTTMANAALLGSLVGLTLGIVEITVRDCYEPSRKGSRIDPFFYRGKGAGGAGFAFSYRY